MSLRDSASSLCLAALDSGAWVRVAREVRDAKEWAARLGFVSATAMRSAMGRVRKTGRHVPSWDEARRGGEIIEAPLEVSTDRYAQNDNAPDFDGEEPTQPAPMTPLVPTGHVLRGLSSLVDADGNIRAQWIKTANTNQVDPAAVLRAAFGEAMPRCEPVEAPTVSDDDLLVVLPAGDPHIGMLAWERDAGENFNLHIAEANLFGAVDRLVSLAPPAKNALVLTVGDTFHSDGLGNATTKGTRVDVDGRTPKMIATGIRVFRRVIDRALEKHQHVTVIIARGNHDELLSLVLAIALAQFYESEPRVTVDTSPEMHHWYRFGANLIGVTHGDKAKPLDLMGVMAVDRAKDWGETKHRRIYAGHIHHEVVKEVPGVTVEYLRTLAGSDAWHRGQGYRSTRSMQMDVFHREHGLVNRHLVGIEQVRG